MTTSTVIYDTSVRPGTLGLVREALREVWSRRRLIGYIVRADMKKKGADTLLGNLWWVIDPLLQMLVYVVLVTVIRGGSTTPDYPLFIFAAILPWKWFSSAVGDGVTSVTSQEALIKQLGQMLDDPKAREAMLTASERVVGQLGGALERTLGALEPYLLQLRIEMGAGNA